MDPVPVNQSFQVDLQVAAGDDELPGGAEWSRWAGAALDLAGAVDPAAARMTVRIVGRDESRQLNKSYRHTDAATNVLAFQGIDKNEFLVEEERELGDLVICLPIVYQEAQQQGKPPLAHLAHLVVHGTLHLIGFDHQDDVNAERMEQLETQVMRRLGFADPYSGHQASCTAAENG
ncbi:MAG: rRNA maturation RNase YbeY [Gammaproteobacteria bacterium]|nr:rRNA maturation RNase YbeY [Gammaproteobacteria bacterium]